MVIMSYVRSGLYTKLRFYAQFSRAFERSEGINDNSMSLEKSFHNEVDFYLSGIFIYFSYKSGHFSVNILSLFFIFYQNLSLNYIYYFLHEILFNKHNLF